MSRRDLIQLSMILARETKATSADILQLLRWARRWDTIAVNQCNRDLTPKEERTKENLRVKFGSESKRIGATGVVLGGDPRGCTVKLTVKSGYTNDWGKEGICLQ
jgi:hypothetical protein